MALASGHRPHTWVATSSPELHAAAGAGHAWVSGRRMVKLSVEAGGVGRGLCGAMAGATDDGGAGAVEHGHVCTGAHRVRPFGRYAPAGRQIIFAHVGRLFPQRTASLVRPQIDFPFVG